MPEREADNVVLARLAVEVGPGGVGEVLRILICIQQCMLPTSASFAQCTSRINACVNGLTDVWYICYFYPYFIGDEEPVSSHPPPPPSDEFLLTALNPID